MTSTDGLLAFLDASPSPYHAVQAASDALRAAGFSELSEADRWTLEAGRGYFLVRGGKTVLAWRQGTGEPAREGFRIVAAHTDSPVLKLRARPGMTHRGLGYLTPEIYGSALVHTWLDRDLKLSGAVFYADGKGVLHNALIDLPDLRLRAMSLAPHLKKEKRGDVLNIDLHNDLPLVFCEGSDPAEALTTALHEAIGGAGTIHSADLSLADIAPSALVGADKAFVSAPRLDNLFSSFTALQALLASKAKAPQTNLIALYDAEEIGSMTWSGARSNVLDATLQRIVLSGGGDQQDFLRAKARSILVSADMAHAEHPSFASATDSVHVPELNKGLAIKASAKGNYASSNHAAAWFALACRERDLALQSFMYRCDHGGGSSVGPLVTADTGIAGVDVGAPMVSMHSIRELGGAKDADHAIACFSAAFETDRGL